VYSRVMYESFANELEKLAAIPRTLLHPAVVGAGLGAAGGALTPSDESRLHGAARGAVAGGAIGAGVKYLPAAIKKSKALKQLHPYAGDIGWMAPSLVATPSIMGAGKKGRGGEQK